METLLNMEPIEIPLEFLLIDGENGRLESLFSPFFPDRERVILEVLKRDEKEPLELLGEYVGKGRESLDVVLLHLKASYPFSGLETLSHIRRLQENPALVIVAFYPQERVESAQEALHRGADWIATDDPEGVNSVARFLKALILQVSSHQTPVDHPQLEFPPEVQDQWNQDGLPFPAIIQGIFPDCATVKSLREAEPGYSPAQKFVVEALKRRKVREERSYFFLKLGRWDLLALERSNYARHIEGQRENFAGRPIGGMARKGVYAGLKY